MRTLVIGASQGTGALVVQEALARGHEVTAFARSPDKLVLEHPWLTRRTGDFHDAASVRAAMPGHDAVVLTASAKAMKGFLRSSWTSLRGAREDAIFFSRGTEIVIAAMKAAGVRRLVVLSALGSGESAKLFNVVTRVLVLSFLLRASFADHERQEALVRASGLDWVIARPSLMTDGPARDAYTRTDEIVPVPSQISRADVAHFLIDAVEDPRWMHKAVQLGG